MAKKTTRSGGKRPSAVDSLGAASRSIRRAIGLAAYAQELVEKEPWGEWKVDDDERTHDPTECINSYFRKPLESLNARLQQVSSLPPDTLTWFTPDASQPPERTIGPIKGRNFHELCWFLASKICNNLCGILSRTVKPDGETQHHLARTDHLYKHPPRPDPLTWETVDAFQEEIAERLIEFDRDDTLLQLRWEYDLAFQKLDSREPVDIAAPRNLAASSDDTSTTPTGSPPEEDGSPAETPEYVDDGDIEILRELKEFAPMLMSFEQIAEIPENSQRTIQQQMPRLEKGGYVARPAGNRKGWAITDKGRAILKAAERAIERAEAAR